MTSLAPRSLDSFHSRKTLTVEGKDYEYFSLPDAEANGLPGIAALPYSLKVLLENLLRFEDGRTVTAEDIRAMAQWLLQKSSTREIAFRPARVLMQDFTGVPAVVDLAAMRDAMAALHGDTGKINPLVPVDLVIDHSVMVDSYGNPRSFEINVDLEYQRNKERYEFLRWGSNAFANFRVVPPGTGICHQVNLEYLAQTVWTKEEEGLTQAFSDTLVGTDSHTTMVNALSVLGWGVGGIEAEAAMLGQPISMVIPEVVGFRFTGALPEGVTATDLVLTVTQMLRKKGVVGKFVEYFGHGLDSLSVEDRATMANMAPEYGATCGFFPVDKDTVAYLRATGRDPHRAALAMAYARAQGLWRDAGTQDPVFTSTLELDLATVEPSLAGPRRPQDRVPLARASEGFLDSLAEMRNVKPGGEAANMVSEGGGSVEPLERSGAVEGENYSLSDGHVVIAAITSCTNTSNPSVLIAAGLLARKAREKGLKPKPWVKTSLAPGSQVVTDYLTKSGLQADLNALGFELVGYGCTTCIGNSGPLPEPISKSVNDNDLAVAAVLSGNRNFEGRVNPDVRANYLASPPLVVAYALAGTMKLNLTTEAIGKGKDGALVFLKDIWPSSAEIAEFIRTFVTPDMFKARYADVFKGDARWQAVGGSKTGQTYEWDGGSTYVQNPPYFEDLTGGAPAALTDIENARVLGLFLEFDNDGPHQPRRLHREVRPGRKVSLGPRRRGCRLQLVRRTARQSRSHDARHFREHPHQEPDDAGHRRRRHDPLPGRPADADLRRRDEIQGRRRAARRLRRARIWHRIEPRLGCERHAPARRAGCDSAELRAHSPLQPCWHGRASSRVRGGRLLERPGAHGQRDRNHPGHKRAQAAEKVYGLHRLRRWREEGGTAPLPDRYARRAQLLHERRHPALRVA